MENWDKPSFNYVHTSQQQQMRTSFINPEDTENLTPKKSRNSNTYGLTSEASPYSKMNYF